MSGASHSASPPALQSFLDFLVDDTFLSNQAVPEFMEPATLAAVCFADPGPHHGAIVPSGWNGPSALPAAGYRPAQQVPLQLLQQRPHQQQQDDGSGGSGSDEDEGKGPAGKRAKGENGAAAKNKASREKARRVKINDRCAFSCLLCIFRLGISRVLQRCFRFLGHTHGFLH